MSYGEDWILLESARRGGPIRWASSRHGERQRAGSRDCMRSLPITIRPLRIYLRYDAGFYRLWPRRALEHGVREVEWLAARHEAVVEALLTLPRTVLHGEFYAANVLVAADTPSARVAPVDWEIAAAGPGVSDLAALVSGDWSQEDRGAIAAAYGSVGGATLDGLDHARLQLAIQWLGWAPPQWAPPKGQRHDWLGEALELAEGLGL